VLSKTVVVLLGNGKVKPPLREEKIAFELLKNYFKITIPYTINYFVTTYCAEYPGGYL
jgi:hypothetical protein